MFSNFCQKSKRFQRKRKQAESHTDDLFIFQSLARHPLTCSGPVWTVPISIPPPSLWWTENSRLSPTNRAKAFTPPRAESSNYTQRALNNNLLPLWREANSIVVLWKINNSRGLQESCRALCALNPNYSNEVLQPWTRSTSLHRKVPLRDLDKSLIFLSGSSWTNEQTV